MTDVINDDGVELWRYDDPDAPKDQVEHYRGAVAWKHLPNGKVIALYDTPYNLRLVVGQQMEPTFDTGFCYPKAVSTLAFAALAQWDGTSDPLDGWVKQAGPRRRRPDGTKESEMIDSYG